jgi:hypothetical protein
MKGGVVICDLDMVICESQAVMEAVMECSVAYLKVLHRN